MAITKAGKKAKQAGDKAEKVSAGAPLWMTTYGDMVTLLLTFFVMLYTSATSIDDSKLQLIATAFTGAFGVMSGGMTLSPGKLMHMGHNIRTLPSKERGRATARKQQPASSVMQAKLESKLLRSTEDERGFVISLAADFFFKPGSAEIVRTKETVEAIREIITVISAVNNEIRIEGHTDNSPIPENTELSEEYDSNWELSSQRAINTLKALFEEDIDRTLTGKRKDFSVAGFADTRPAQSNDRPEGRRANRRVDIVFIRDDVTYFNQR